jgi:hypothetical protein
MLRPWRPFVLHAACLLTLAPWVSASEDAETHRVIAGRPEYGDVSGMHRRTFGEGRRSLWVTPFEVGTLDMATYAGGLSTVRRVGSVQSIGLALKGKDGKSYTFRKLDKDPTKILPPEWRDTWPARVFQDQTSSAHPGGGFIVPPLAEAAGVPHTTPHFVFMPDDPALGEFRATFGGQAGTIEEYPTPAEDGYRGFEGATEMVTTGRLWTRWLAGEGWIDTKALLRARLFDLFIGDWDRHNGQWRWMALPGHEGLEPLPEDRDQAFSNYGGWLIALARGIMPRFVEWRSDYDNVAGLVSQGREVDAWLLATVERPAYLEAARDLQTRLTNEVIEDAVRRLPPEWYAVGGEELTRDLEKRRDLLVEAAEAFYREVARRVDVQGTDKDDVARLSWQADGSALLQVSTAGSEGSPERTYFERRFRPEETETIRIYLYGGADRFVATGAGKGITVRVSGGPGPDVLDDSGGGGTHFYDVAGQDRVARGPGTHVSGRQWTRVPHKPETPWMEKRDYGALTLKQVLAWWEPDPGVILSGGLTHYRYGFRKQPYSSLHHLQLDWKTGRGALKASYDLDHRWAAPGFHNTLELWADGAKNYNFYGFGNETSSEGGDERFDAHQQVFYAFPSVVAWENERRTFSWAVGPQVKYSLNEAADDTLIGQTRPYGFDDFGQVGARARLTLDSRGRRLLGMGLTGDPSAGRGKRTDTGVRLELDGSFYPKAWDVESSFGSAEGTLAGYWQTSSWLTLAGRVGGRQVWGTYPWGESAFLGGSDTNRGFDRNRFAGDSSFYGNVEARFALGYIKLVLPVRWGLFALADAGRVWTDGETSSNWHPSWGGGLFLRIVPTDAVVHAAVATSDETTKFYVDYGFGF